MGTDKVAFEGEQWRATGSDVSHETGSDVSHVPCPEVGSAHVQPEVAPYPPSRAFWPEVTKSRDWKRPCPEVAMTGRRFSACPAFFRAFFLVVVTWLPKVTWSLRGSLLVYATGSCATPVMTEGHVTPLGSIIGVFSTTSASYNPRKPASYI